MAYCDKPFVKVLLLGNPYVGKTALVNRYVNKMFKKNYNVTLGVDFFTQDIVLNDRFVAMQIWDTAGMETFHSLGTRFYRGAHGCILVFDVTNRNSFESLNSWHDEFLIQANPQDATNFPFVVLGNKADRTMNRQVSMREAQQWCKSHDVIYYETSAKDDSCVEIAFESIAAAILDARPLIHSADSFIVVENMSKRQSKCKCS